MGGARQFRYSGFWSDANYKQHLEELQAAIQCHGSGRGALVRAYL
jgi:hypothetical protein